MRNRILHAIMVAAAASVVYAATSINTATTQNNTIRDETINSANTATRIGNALNGILEASTLEISEKTSGFQAAAGFAYSIDSSGGSITVTTPAIPIAGDMFEVIDKLGTWQANPVTVDFGSSPLHNLVSPNNQYIGNGNYAHRVFRYDGVRWLIVQ